MSYNKTEKSKNNDSIFTPRKGVWHWQTEPRAINKNNITFYSYVTPEGSLVVASYNEENKNEKSYILKKNWKVDDHLTPSILIRKSDHHIIVFFSRNSDIYYFISKEPLDITSFGPEKIIPAVNSTYAHAVQLDSGDIYLFSRDEINGKKVPVFRKSTDKGQSWKKSIMITHSRDWLYPKAVRDRNNTIHLIITGNPYHDSISNVWYIKLEKGEYKTANGAVKGKFGDILNRKDFDIIHNANNTGIPSRASDLTYDNSNFPTIVYVLYKGQARDKHEYRYARWNGEQWINNFISATEPISKTSKVGWVYFGGITLKEGEPNIVAFSKKINNHFQIIEGKSMDYGLNWEFQQLTKEKNDSLRPWYVIDGNKINLIYLKGKIKRFNDYNTRAYSIKTFF